MKYIKEYNSYSIGIEELGSNLWWGLHQVQQKYGYSTFTKRELDFFRNFFRKSDRHDFFRISGTSKTRRSTFNFKYMSSIDPKNPIKVCIRRLGDDYYYISIEFLTNSQSKYSEYNDSNKPDNASYLIDNYEDLVDFLKDIDKIHKILDNS